ncbi:hypothetical protein KUV65_05055 [Maritalea mobilis]|nr:hypothetical protein [Maritalea mobilis]MBY6200720.1 hypothetical protein [Maritalea mobilis]
MTPFEIAIPLIALAVAGIGVMLMRHETRKLDARIEAEARRRHPAE